MIDQKTVDWKYIPRHDIINSDINGKAVAFIIDTEVVDTIAATDWFVDLIVSVDSFDDAGSDEINGLHYVNLVKDGETIETLLCDEKLYSILLSGSQIIALTEIYENYMLIYPGWHFIDNKFVL